MDYCKYKLNEASYFLEQMKELQKVGDLIVFSYNLNAFLTATRSIITYVRDKVKNKDINRIVQNDDKIFFFERAT